MSRLLPTRRAHAAILSALAAFAIASPSPAGAVEAFNALKGSWSGSGTASFEGGQTEQLRCSAHYSGGGDTISINLKCASASAQINLQGSLEASGNRVSGVWSETSYGMSGDAFGSASGSTVRLRISGGATGTLALSVSGSSQSVSVTTKTATLRSVSVRMRRR